MRGRLPPDRAWSGSGRGTRVGPLWSRQRISPFVSRGRDQGGLRVGYAAPVKPDAPAKPRSRRPMVVGYVALIIAIFGTGAMVAYRARREAHAEELQILQGVRRVCKLATVEVSLADYAKKTVPKTLDLPFTKEPEAYLFYAGIVSAG